MRKVKNNFFVVISVVLLVNLIAENEGKKMGKQGDGIDKIYQAEFLRKSSVKREVRKVVELSQIVAANTGSVENQISNHNSKEKDRIEKLPGQPFVKFSQYGGYITVDETAGRAFYYYFVESETPLSSPLFLWLNGGPGCSSLGYGAMHEIGPFRVLSDGKTLYRNPYSWNRFANLLFVESPARVGFSYSNRTTDYITYGDGSTAADNYRFMVKWMERYPEYKDRDLYIGGESYAGHYVPQLANLILHHNSIPNFPFIRIKGILIGNGAINVETDVEGMFDYFAGHGLCSLENIEDVKRNCKFTAQRNDSALCLDAIYKTYINTDHIDIYSIFAPTCDNEAQAAFSIDKIPSVEVIDPCSMYYVFIYFNSPEVQTAIHANTTKLNYTWNPCNDDMPHKWVDKSDSLHQLQLLMSKGVRIWLFSGDQDAKIPFLATKYSLKRMNLTIKTEWYAWFSNGEVGGYTEEYNGNITFATVRGAGHEVPYYQPRRVLTLFEAFISGTSLQPKHPYPPPDAPAT